MTCLWRSLARFCVVFCGLACASEARPPADMRGGDAGTADAAPADGSPDAGDGEGGAGDAGRHDAAAPACDDESDPCPGDARCIDGVCVGGSPCTRDDECADDTYCTEGRCVPWEDRAAGGHDTACIETRRPDLEGRPRVQCQWRGGSVHMSPVVVDLDGLPTEGRRVPEIVFVATRPGLVPTQLVAVRGDDCSELWRTALPSFSFPRGLVAGDLNGDGLPEIVIAHGSGMRAFDGDGEELWFSDALPLALWPVLADADLDGDADVITERGVLEGDTGRLLWAGESDSPRIQPVVADVDLDGETEVLLGRRILDAATGADETPAALVGARPGALAVAELDGTTPQPEIVLASGDRFGDADVPFVRVLRSSDGLVVAGPITLPDHGRDLNDPSVADVDGDGRSEIVVSSGGTLAVIDLDCVGESRPAACEADGILWTQPVEEDFSSTVATTFDFDRDGDAEIVYGDACFVRAYDGTTGRPFFGLARVNSGFFDAPIVADTDGDGHSELVIGEGWTALECPERDPETGVPSVDGLVEGITVYSGPRDLWAPSRPVWNQSSYHVTNVRPDGTIPSPELNSWETVNSYRSQAAGPGEPTEVPLPDATLRFVGVDISTCPARLAVRARVANRGVAWLPRRLPVAFFTEDPANPGVVASCTTGTAEALRPGATTEVRCLLDPDTLDGDGRVWAQIRPEGELAECNFGNNGALATGFGCPAPG